MGVIRQFARFLAQIGLRALPALAGVAAMSCLDLWGISWSVQVGVPLGPEKMINVVCLYHLSHFTDWFCASSPWRRVGATQFKNARLFSQTNEWWFVFGIAM